MTPDKPIFQHHLTPTAWRLLWWLLCQMDEDSELALWGWRQRAAEELTTERTWATKCAAELQEAGLIAYKPRSRVVRVMVKNILG